MEYDLELERVKKEIRKANAKKVLIQLADGLKPQATKIVRELEETGAAVHVWASTCFGACDIPDVKGYDLLVHFGHSEWSN